MPKDTPRIFHHPSEVQIDSEGNQSIDIRDLARDQRVKKDLTKLREGFVAEQQYRKSLATGNTSTAEPEADTSVTEKPAQEIRSQQFEQGKEEAGNRFLENESS